MSAAEHDAKLVHEAVAGLGTDERALAEVLCTISDRAMLALHEAYPRVYQKSLVDDVKGEWINGDLKKLLLAVMNRCKAPEASHGPAQVDADALYKAGEGKWGTDENTFVRIFGTRPRRQLAEINAAYTAKYGHTLQKAVQKEFSGHLKWALWFLVEPPHLYFASKMREAMAGLGSDKDTMTEVLAFRKDRDLARINEAYVQAHQKTLLHAFESESSGDYRKLLTAYVRQVV